jgi:putative heme-binding domain-containing protein
VICQRCLIVAVAVAAVQSPLSAREGAASAKSSANERKSSAARSQIDVRQHERRKTLEKYVLTHAGDPQRGRELFFDEKNTRCVACHKVQGQGAEVGPDLSHVGGKFDRPHLIESLVEPSRQIVEGYRTSVALTADGRAVSGVISRRTDSTLTLVDSEARTHEIAWKDVDAIHDSNISTMPESVIDFLSAAQFADLVAYLETLRLDGPATPGAGVVAPITLPDGFDVEVIAVGLDACTAMKTTPDGDVFICEQTGALRRIHNGTLLEQPLIAIPVDSTWERGLIGVTIDPNFRESPFVYLCYVAKQPYPHHRVSRFSAQGNRLLPESEKMLLIGDDQRTLGGTVPAGHQGGALHFGRDGKLYIGIGEQTNPGAAQALNTLQGKILRINPDGSIPADNPLLLKTSGKYQAIWAYGLRNPFSFAFDTVSNEMLINDVGGKNEEINRGIAGGNYGWPLVEHGTTDDPRFVGPIHWYPEASISGAAFVPDGISWPAEYQKHFFFADFVHGAIYALDPNKPGSAKRFATGLRRPIDLRFAPDGSLYVLQRNAWVIDENYLPKTGSLLRIVPPKPVLSGR